MQSSSGGCLPASGPVVPWGGKHSLSQGSLSWSLAFQHPGCCSSFHFSALTLPSWSSAHASVIGLSVLFCGLVCLSPPPSFLCICVVYEYVCDGMCADAYAHVCGNQRPTLGILDLFPTLFLSQDPSLNLELTDWLAILAV